MLLASQPEGDQAPPRRKWCGDETNTGHTEAKPGEQRIRPGADLIARAINERVDEAFRFVFVFATQHGEKDFPCWTGDSEIPGAAQCLKGCQQAERGRESHGKETDHTDDREERERDADTQPLKEPSGEEDLHDDGKDVDREIDLREKRRPRRAIVKLMRGDVRLD